MYVRVSEKDIHVY